MGPRSAKSAQQDGKLQKSSALCPPPRFSRNSRPSALAPQLIHSPARGRPCTSIPASAPAAPRRPGPGPALGALRPCGVSTPAARSLRAPRQPSPRPDSFTRGRPRRGARRDPTASQPLPGVCPAGRGPVTAASPPCPAPPLPRAGFVWRFDLLRDGARRGPRVWPARPAAACVLLPRAHAAGAPAASPPCWKFTVPSLLSS